MESKNILFFIQVYYILQAMRIIYTVRHFMMIAAFSLFNY